MHSDKQVKTKKGSALSYHAFVEKLVKKFPLAMSILSSNPSDEDVHSLAKEFDKMAHKLEVCHAAIGIHTEGGEVADVLKAYAIYGKPLDRDALVKELGDVRFWIMDIQNKFNISDHEIAQGNADKLGERYDKLVYSDAEAIARVDKKYIVSDKFRMGHIAAGPFEHEYEATNACDSLNIGYVLPVYAVYKLD